MNKSVYQVGNTVKFRARFGDFEGDGKIVTPEDVQFIIYDSEWSQIHKEPITEKDQDGFYIAYYVFEELGNFYCEWIGLFNGLPSLERKEISIKWI